MKILLSTTPTEGQFKHWATPKYLQPWGINKHMPLGILSLATNLPDGHDVKVIDPGSENWSIDKTISIINNEQPDIFGLSVQTRRVYAMKQILEKIDIPYVAVGGPHATYYAEQILGFGADAVFVGSLTDIEFRENIKRRTKGIIYCDSDINKIKFPRREFLNVKEYYPKSHVLFKAKNRLTMFSSVGCPFKCRFCNVQSKKLKLKNGNIVLDEMEYLQSIGCGSIHMTDDNFNVSRIHLVDILDEMDKRGFNMEWSARGQVKMDYSLLPRLREHGFKRIHVGLEALDDEILKYFNKHETVDDINKFCKHFIENNIDILGYFILGSPIDTKEYRKDFPDKIRELGIKYPFFNILFPEPDTEYYNQLVKSGIYKRDYWKGYMENPTPNYELPYPYGEDKKEEVFDYVQDLIEEFKA